MNEKTSQLPFIAIMSLPTTPLSWQVTLIERIFGAERVATRDSEHHPHRHKPQQLKVFYCCNVERVKRR